MILKSVDLNNFRLFYGNQKLDLKDNDLNVIVGNNATGKSSIVEAIKWCLYGLGSSSILNFKAAEEGGEKTVSVKCSFEDEDDLILIKRSIIFDENNNVGSSTLVIMVNDVLFENPHYFIENKFPKDLYDFAENSLEEQINSLKMIINKECGIDDVFKIRNHLNIIKMNYIKELNKFNPNSAESIILIEKKLVEVSERIEMNNLKIKEVDYKINEISNVYSNFPDIKNLINEKEMLTKKLDELSVNLKNKENELSLLLIKNLPLSMVHSHYLSSNDYLNLEEIETLIYENAPDGDMVIRYHNLKENLANLSNDKIDALSSDIRVLEKAYQKTSSDIKNIESQLKLNNSLIEEMKINEELIKHREHLLVEKAKLSHDKKSLMNELKSLSKNIIDFNIHEIEIKIKFISDVISSIEELIDGIDGKTNEDLIDSINKYFLENSFLDYDELKIDGRYNIFLLKSGFKIKPQDLSNAEMDLLKLSLILSIRDFSDNKFPLIFDTPFMRLDTNGRESVVNMLKNIDGQIILLLNESEALGFSKDYELQFSEGNGVIVHGK